MTATTEPGSAGYRTVEPGSAGLVPTEGVHSTRTHTAADRPFRTAIPGDSLFAPVPLHGVAKGLEQARLLVAAILLGIPTLGCFVLSLLVSPLFAIGTALFGGLLIWLCWLVPRQVGAIGFAERDDDLLIRSGIMFRKLVVVPYGRMQYIDVHVGPLDRALGIAKVQLHTAAVSTNATIPGLPIVEAERLRDQLAARGEARMVGL